jgi:hypothetical protein
MNSHKNASLTPKGRETMVRCVEAGLSNAAAARQFNTTPKTVAKWVERFRAGGVDGLRDEGNGRAGSCHRFLDHVSEKGGWIDAKRAALDCSSARPRATMAEPIVIDPAPARGDPNACLCAMRQTRVRRFGSAVVI